MEVVRFNNEIYELLIKCGFRYCCYKTIVNYASPIQISIILTPVRSNPALFNISRKYDAHFYLTHKPQQMADGIDDDTPVYIDLNHTLLKECYEQENTDH